MIAPKPSGWEEVDSIDAAACVYGIQDGKRCVWIDADGLNVLEDPDKPGSQAVPIAAVLHVLAHAGAGS